tara:strand:- start:3851 stop:4426 length:576 start_codon:yes stop_codon:yes gene_type:complete
MIDIALNEFDVNDSFKGIFLLILAVMGNFIAETLGCKTQKLLSDNMLVKHLVTFLILYFAIGFTSSEIKHPGSIAINALLIWGMLILFSRMSIEFTVIVFGLLTGKYVLTTFTDYYKKLEEEKLIKDEKEKMENSKKIEDIEEIGKYIIYSIGILVAIGFTLYFQKQYSEHYEGWSTYKFIFGINKCDSMK